MSVEAPAPAAIAPRERSQALDLFKTALVVGMVATHVIQLISRDLPAWTYGFAEFINLLTFSGFLLAMGMGLGLSDGRRQRSWPARLRPAMLLLMAAYLSALAYETLVEWEPVTAELVLDIVTLRRLFGWSEFLATFFMLYLLVALGRGVLLAVAERPLFLVLACVLCLATTVIISDAGWPLSATLVGTREFASFPLLPYLPWFLLGAALGRVGAALHLWHWVLAGQATAAFYLAGFHAGEPPSRFPPDILWIAGPALFLLAYLAIAQALAARIRLPDLLLLPGRHVLSYLLISNLVIFTVRHLGEQPVDTVEQWLLASAAILGAIGVLWWLVEKFGAGKRSIHAAPASARHTPAA